MQKYSNDKKYFCIITLIFSKILLLILLLIFGMGVTFATAKVPVFADF